MFRGISFVLKFKLTIENVHQSYEYTVELQKKKKKNSAFVSDIRIEIPSSGYISHSMRFRMESNKTFILVRKKIALAMIKTN